MSDKWTGTKQILPLYYIFVCLEAAQGNFAFCGALWWHNEGWLYKALLYSVIMQSEKRKLHTLDRLCSLHYYFYSLIWHLQDLLLMIIHVKTSGWRSAHIFYCKAKEAISQCRNSLLQVKVQHSKLYFTKGLYTCCLLFSPPNSRHIEGTLKSLQLGSDAKLVMVT